ncbi:hypothetical protein EDC18_103428 [Natranaerovirga pectinivora]|uniref:Uncharacterized protein n=1 Tax=Natranaerovirga pectinivora TaxID=682400 RepID=A0A4R3MLY4_9FIRM|nr:hypothetical protein [Natranaerovirga pectinivora]TCT15716.1 hypothetical protein EDC18_103428 [Natranaerovirga pectinivora]
MKNKSMWIVLGVLALVIISYIGIESKQKKDTNIDLEDFIIRYYQSRDLSKDYLRKEEFANEELYQYLREGIVESQFLTHNKQNHSVQPELIEMTEIGDKRHFKYSVVVSFNYNTAREIHSSYGQVIEIMLNKNNKIEDINNVNREPSFVDVYTAKEELKSTLYGAIGWSVAYPVDSYMYSNYGNYLLRYNINTNRIDKVLVYEDSFWDAGLNISKSGNYAILFKTNYRDIYSNVSSICIIDFINEEVNYLALSEKQFNVEDIPEDIRNEFELESILTSNLYIRRFDNLKYEIKFESDKERGRFFLYEGEEKLHELTVLEGRGVVDYTYVWIDEKTIGVLMPIDDDVFELGYYKFAIVDVIEDRIIQEYPINTRK